MSPLLAYALLGLAGGLFYARGRLLPGAADGRAPALPRWGRAYLAVMVLAALSYRAWLAARFQVGNTETYSVLRACNFQWTTFDRTAEGQYHPPLQPLVLRTYLGLAASLGAPLGLLGARAPSLLLGAASQVLLARVGVLLRAPLAGLAAATLLGFLPFPIRVSVLQENYVFELTSALWFVERCLQYVAWRRPVYRTLALSAAVALGSGYMNVPLLGIGAVILGATALARREFRAALFTLVATALLVAPIVPSFLQGGQNYALVSVHAGLSADEAARRQAAARHPVLPVEGSFSRGRAGKAVLGVADGLLGRQSYLFFAGLLLLAVWQRWRALPLFALLLCFPLLGTRILLNPQNYGSMIPFFLLATTWGIEGLARLVFRDSSERAEAAALLLEAAAVTLGLLGGHARSPLLSTRPEPTFFFFEYKDLDPWRRALAGAPRDTPVLAYNFVNAPVFHHDLCVGEQPVCRWSDCENGGDGAAPDGEGIPWDFVLRAGRETATPRTGYAGSLLGRSLAGYLDDFFARPAWARRGALVLRGRDLPSNPEIDALDRRLNRHCSRLADEPAYVLLRCTPEQAAALRADPASPR